MDAVLATVFGAVLLFAVPLLRSQDFVESFPAVKWPLRRAVDYCTKKIATAIATADVATKCLSHVNALAHILSSIHASSVPVGWVSGWVHIVGGWVTVVVSTEDTTPVSQPPSV